MTTEDRYQPDEAFMRNAVNSFLHIGFLLLLIILVGAIGGAIYAG
jgi:hypothetical protein